MQLSIIMPVVVNVTYSYSNDRYSYLLFSVRCVVCMHDLPFGAYTCQPRHIHQHLGLHVIGALEQDCKHGGL